MPSYKPCNLNTSQHTHPLQLNNLANQSNVKTVVKTFNPTNPKNRNIKITFTFLF